MSFSSNTPEYVSSFSTQRLNLFVGRNRSILRMSGFLLSLVSPVCYSMLCGTFREKLERRLLLEAIESAPFKTLLQLASGDPTGIQANDLNELIELARTADFLQMDEVRNTLESELIKHTSVNTCLDLLTVATSCGLRQLEDACRILALEEFETVSLTNSFLVLEEDILASLLDDDRLMVGSEERVFEIFMRWATGKNLSVFRAGGCLSAIRFPLMADKFKQVLEICAEICLEISEADLTGKKSHLPRARTDIAWDEYATGKELEERLLMDTVKDRSDALEHNPAIIPGLRRVQRLAYGVSALAECRGFICSGSADSKIRLWDMRTHRHRGTLRGHSSPVLALTRWCGLLVSGAIDGSILVWDVLSMELEGRLEGHQGGVDTLCVCGQLLLSGSDDSTIRVWAPPPAWRCERTLSGHTEQVCTLLAWKGKAISGSVDRTIRVWDVAAGRLEHTLQGHEGSVRALATDGRFLISSSRDSCLRMWALDTWACVRVVAACGEDQYVRCLCVSGGKLVGGTIDNGVEGREDVAYTVSVWDLESPDCHREQTLPQPAGSEVWALLSVGGAVWGAVGEQVAVWGRHPPPAVAEDMDRE